MKKTTTLALIPVISLLPPTVLSAASLEPVTCQAWEEYIALATVSMERRLTVGNAFLWVDERPQRAATVRTGEIVVSPAVPQIPRRVPAGLIHDWIGAAFIPNVTINDVLQVTRDYPHYNELYRPTVVESKVISTDGSRDRYSMLLVNKSVLLKTAFEIDLESRYVRIDDRRSYSISKSTRIQQIEEYGSAAQHRHPEGTGDGMMWRLFSFSRYVERDGGVYLELEVIGLSRDIPSSLKWLIDPIARRVSRNTLATSLRQSKDAVRARVEAAKVRTKSGGVGTLDFKTALTHER